MADLTAMLTEARRSAESLMVDLCAVTRPSSTVPAIDETTGRYTTPPPAYVYEGRCRIQIRGMGSSTTPEAGGAEWVVQQSVLQLPVTGSEDVRVGDLFEMVECVSDGALTGRKAAIVRRLSDKSHATKREFLLAETGATGAV